MFPPQISIIIPLYNEGPHITRALTSVFSQTVQDFEVIIVDGNSTDEGPSIVKNWDDPRITFFIQEGIGVSAARNQGVERSKTEFIAFLDADDEWDDDHLEALLKLYKRFPEAGLYTTAHYNQYSSNIRRICNISSVPQEPWEGLIPRYFKNTPAWTSAVGISKSIFMEMNGFNTSVRIGEDTDLWGRIALKYPVAFSWSGKAVYHLDASNRVCNSVEPLEEHIFINTALRALDQNKVKPEHRDDLRRYITGKQIERIQSNIHAGRPDLAMALLIKNIKTNDMKFRDWMIVFKILVEHLTQKALFQREGH